MSKDTEQLIKEAAKAAHIEREATLKEAKRIPMSSEYCDGYEKGVTAGATFYRDELLRGEMERFLNWVDRIRGNDEHYYWNSGLKLEYTTSQLYDKYFEHREQELIKSKNK